MTRKQFKTFMKEYKSLDEDGYKLNEVFKVFEPDFGYITFSRYKELIYNILRVTMNDEENDWIGYFIWGQNWGKNNKPGNVKIRGKNIPLKTVDDLYNILTLNNKDN